jgi:hypothetical protein
VQVVLALHLLQHAQLHLPPRCHHPVQVVLALHLLQHAPNVTFLLPASSPSTVRGNNSMGHAWLPAELTMRMEQHKVERIVSRVQVTDPP